MSATSVVRILTKADNEEPIETIIIKRCNMDLENEITDEELAQIIKDMEETDPEELEGLGDEDMDDEEIEDEDLEGAEDEIGDYL